MRFVLNLLMAFGVFSLGSLVVSLSPSALLPALITAIATLFVGVLLHKKQNGFWNLAGFITVLSGALMLLGALQTGIASSALAFFLVTLVLLGIGYATSKLFYGIMAGVAFALTLAPQALAGFFLPVFGSMFLSIEGLVHSFVIAAVLQLAIAMIFMVMSLRKKPSMMVEQGFGLTTLVCGLLSLLAVAYGGDVINIPLESLTEAEQAIISQNFLPVLTLGGALVPYKFGLALLIATLFGLATKAKKMKCGKAIAIVFAFTFFLFFKLIASITPSMALAQLLTGGFACTFAVVLKRMHEKCMTACSGGSCETMPSSPMKTVKAAPMKAVVKKAAMPKVASVKKVVKSSKPKTEKSKTSQPKKTAKAKVAKTKKK